MQINDRNLELVIAQMLRAGVLLSALVVAIGGFVLLRAGTGAPLPDYTHFGATGETFTSGGSIIGAATHGSGAGIVMCGLLLLIATPVARVVVAGVGFLLERDRLYAIVSAIVLTVLLYSIFFGR